MCETTEDLVFSGRRRVSAMHSRDPFDTEFLKADLASRSVKGGAATVVAQWMRFALRLVSVAILARLLGVQDFGLVAMVTAITNFIMMFKDMGLSSATVQQLHINHSQISTLFWLNTAIGAFLTVLTCVSAPAVAWFYGEPSLTGITIGLSMAFVFAGLTIQHQALLRRQMRFLALGVIDVVAMLCGTCVAVVTAYFGARYWALVAQQLVMAACTAVGVWVASGWRPGWPARASGVRPMIIFGGNVSGFHFVNYFSRNLDNVLLGRVWGSYVLGLYSRAYGLLMLPISQLTAPLSAVAMPALSRIQDDARKYAGYYTRYLRALSFFGMPLVALLAVCSRSAIVLLLGEKWIGASRIFQFLAIAAFIQPVSSTNGAVLLSMGQSRRLLIAGCFSSAVTVCSFAIGVVWGAIGVAIAYAAATYLTLVPLLWYSFRKTPVSMMGFFQAISRPAIASLVMAGVTTLVLSLVGDQHEIVVLGLCSLVGVVTYLLAWILMPGGTTMLREIGGYVPLLAPKGPMRQEQAGAVGS